MEQLSKSKSADQFNRPSPRSGFSIAIKDLSKRFNREWIFKNISYTFSSGTTYAITGPNGSGKSTFLQVLWGQMPQTAGIIHYKAAETTVNVEDAYQYVSIAAPYMDLVDEFTLIEQLQFHFKLKKIRNNLTIDDLVQIMYLEPARDKFIGNFSSGMRQRVKLALAFFTESSAIFLDEPGTNLDHQAFEWYTKQLHQAAQDRLLIIASNNPQEYPPDATSINILDHK